MILTQLAEKATNKDIRSLLNKARAYKPMHNLRSRLNASLTKLQVLERFESLLTDCESNKSPMSVGNKYNILKEFQEQIKYISL